MIILFTLKLKIPFFPYCIIRGFILALRNFSLIAFENDKNAHDKYLKKLNKKFKFFEGFFRLLVFIFLLLFLANMHKYLIVLGELFFPFKIINYGLFDNGTDYFLIYKGFPFLKDVILFNYVFFILLIFWDIIVYIGNLLNKNKLSINDFFNRFIKQHLWGFVIWFLGSFLLLTEFGHNLIHHWYVWVIIVVAIISIFYLITVLKSLKGLYYDFKHALYISHE